MTGETERMNSYKRQLLCIGLGIVIALLRALLSAFPTVIDTYYSKGINKWWIEQLSRLSALFRFSIFELLIYIAIVVFVAALIFYSIKLIQNHKKWGSLILQYLLNLLAAFSIGYCIFILFWGLNYDRPSLEADFSLASEGHDPEELIALYEQLIQQVNEARLNTRENEQGIFIANGSYHDIFKRAPIGYEHAAQTYPVLSGTYGLAKPILTSKLMNYTNITGIYSPFTAEANVNVAVPDSTLLFTTMHEMAHQRGYASENEANFIAFLTCIHHPDPDFIYAGYLSALKYTNVALAKVDSESLIELNAQLSDGVRRDMRYLNQFWAQYEGKVEETFNSMNQTYLTLNGIKDGVRSYGRVVDLLLAYYDHES